MAFANPIDFDGLMEPVCRRLLGTANPRLSKPPAAPATWIPVGGVRVGTASNS
jgi:hypothetical protein